MPPDLTARGVEGQLGFTCEDRHSLHDGTFLISTYRLIDRAIGSVEMVEGGEELSIWLARRVTRLAHAINPCFIGS